MGEGELQVISEDSFQKFLRLTLSSLQMNLAVCRHLDMTNIRYADPKRLIKHGHKIYSQGDEDGIIAEIFRRIGTSTDKTFVEVGVGDGTQCNTAALLVQGWKGAWVEGNEKRFNDAVAIYKDSFIASGQLAVLGCCADMANINELVCARDFKPIDLLSIDIDGNDFWVWKALDRVKPRVVVIEYNALFPPPAAMVIPYNPQWVWDGTNYMGASLQALVNLGNAKGYRIVGCGYSGANAFFVREDLCGDLFKGPATAEEHYEPLRYYAALAIGHVANPASHDFVSADGSTYNLCVDQLKVA
jgi:hypothetical protein